MFLITTAVLSSVFNIFRITSCEVLTNDVININSKTTNGNETASNKSPAFVVSIQEYRSGYYKHLCGGAIIDEQFVISAAHCVLKPRVIDKSHIYVTGGSPEIFGKNSTRFRVIGMSTHIRFKFLKGNDILLLRVFPKFSLDGRQFRKLNIRESKKRGTGLDSVLLGWGRLGSNPNNPKNLESLIFQTIDNSVCLKQYRFKYITDSEICAVHADKGPRGACDGDSGGPLVDANMNVLYGLLSYGRRACQALKPYAFTRISTHVNWIEEQMTKLRKIASG